eukprot:9834428-Heterocapsa_arctica.AAC.1
MQLLNAKEEVNSTRRRLLKSKGKRDKVLKEVTIAKDEMAASRAAHDSAVGKLDKLEKAIKAQTEQPKDDPVVTEEELEVLKRVRFIRAGNAGAVGGMPYQPAVAEIIEGHGCGLKVQEAPKGLAPKADLAG